MHDLASQFSSSANPLRRRAEHRRKASAKYSRGTPILNPFTASSSPRSRRRAPPRRWNPSFGQPLGEHAATFDGTAKRPMWSSEDARPQAVPRDPAISGIKHTPQNEAG